MAQCSATEGEDFECKVPVHITLSHGMSLTKLRADQEIRKIQAKIVEQYEFLTMDLPDQEIRENQAELVEQFKLSVIAYNDDTRRLREIFHIIARRWCLNR